MKEIVLTKEEAKVIVLLLRREWPPVELQKLVFELVTRLEKELES